MQRNHFLINLGGRTESILMEDMCKLNTALIAGFEKAFNLLEALLGRLQRIFTQVPNITLLAESDAPILHLCLLSRCVFIWSFGCDDSDKFPIQIRDSLSTSACWENPGNLAFS